MTFRKIILFLLISLSLVANAQARMPTERPVSTSASIFELPPFERAVCCIRFYEGMHRAKDYPYVGMDISSDLGSVTLLICRQMKQSNFFEKTSESYVLCFVPMVKTPYSLLHYHIISDHTR